MNSYYFFYKGNKYGVGTIVKIYDKYKENFNFCITLQFTGCGNFAWLYDTWKTYHISDEQIELYIEKILAPCDPVDLTNQTQKRDPKYIDGIVSAWIWYIIFMFFALFLKGILTKFVLWGLISYVFFSWRHKKINGG